MRTSVRKVEEAITAGDRNSGAGGAEGSRAGDHARGAEGRVVHKNTASRKVSRLSHQIAKLAISLIFSL